MGRLSGRIMAPFSKKHNHSIKRNEGEAKEKRFRLNRHELARLATGDHGSVFDNNRILSHWDFFGHPKLNDAHQDFSDEQGSDELVENESMLGRLHLQRLQSKTRDVSPTKNSLMSRSMSTRTADRHSIVNQHLMQNSGSRDDSELPTPVAAAEQLPAPTLDEPKAAPPLHMTETATATKAPKEEAQRTSLHQKRPVDLAPLKIPDEEEMQSHRRSNPATGAYRDMVTGAVVETDDKGDQATPTEHPNIYRTPSEPHRQSLPSVALPPLSMPGLSAAANFLPQDADDADISGHMSEDESSIWGHDVTAQVTGFAVASSKRNADFHALFPNVSDDDFLIETNACAIARDFLIQGRMFVSERHLCFHSNIFGWITSVVVPFVEIISIEKKSTAYLIPNAILVRTLHSKFMFTSLVTRDLTYSMLVNIWRNLVTVNQSCGSTRENAERDPLQEMGNYSFEGIAANEASDHTLSKRDRLRKYIHEAREFVKKHESNDASADGMVQGHRDGNEDDTDSVASENELVEHEKTTCACSKNGEHAPNVVSDDVLPLTPLELFQILFTSDLMKEFLSDQQHLIDVEIGEWCSGSASGATATRKINYIKPLNGAVGPKQTRCEITEEQMHIDFNDYCTMITTTRTPDVPSGNSFEVRTRTCFMWAGGSRRSRMLVTCSVEWSGRSMLKSIIDKASIDGQKQYYADLIATVKEHVRDHPDLYGADAARGADENVKKEKAKAENEVLASEAPYAADQNPLMAAFQSMANSVHMRPTVLALMILIVVLLASNIWLYVHGPPGGLRNSRLGGALSLTRMPMSLRHVELLLDDEVQQVLAALEHSRRVTEELESEFRVLHQFIQEQNKVQQLKLLQ